MLLYRYNLFKPPSWVDIWLHLFAYIVVLMADTLRGLPWARDHATSFPCIISFNLEFLMLFSITHSHSLFFLLISIADTEKYWGWCFWALLIHYDLSRSFHKAARFSRVLVPKHWFVEVFGSLTFCIHCNGFIPPCFRGPSLTPLLTFLKRAGPLWPLEAGCRSVYPFYGPTSRLGILVVWFPRGGRPECGPVKCNQGLFSVCFRLSQTSWLPHLDLSSQGWYKSLRGQAWIDGFLPVVCWAKRLLLWIPHF